MIDASAAAAISSVMSALGEPEEKAGRPREDGEEKKNSSSKKAGE